MEVTDKKQLEKLTEEMKTNDEHQRDEMDRKDGANAD